MGPRKDALGRGLAHQTPPHLAAATHVPVRGSFLTGGEYAASAELISSALFDELFHRFGARRREVWHESDGGARR